MPAVNFPIQINQPPNNLVMAWPLPPERSIVTFKRFVGTDFYP
jgi:hypothetical protein